MNILFLMKYYKLGGQEIVTNHLATHFINKGHQVSIACFTSPSLEMMEKHNPDINFIELKGGYSIKLENIKSLRNILVSGRFDVIINQWGLPFIPIFVAKRACKGGNGGRQAQPQRHRGY